MWTCKPSSTHLQGLLPLIIGRADLTGLQPDEVMVDKWQGVPVRARYYMIMDAECPLRVGRLGPEEADGESACLR